MTETEVNDLKVELRDALDVIAYLEGENERLSRKLAQIGDIARA